MAAKNGTFDKDCLFTTVQNNTGGKRKFGFLPPHGVELAAAGQYSIFGNILEAVGNGSRGGSRRNQQALARALDRGDLTILNTPRQIIKDETTLLPKMLRLNSGTLTTVDPCWLTSDVAQVIAP
jgi:hypothetical protein